MNAHLKKKSYWI